MAVGRFAQLLRAKLNAPPNFCRTTDYRLGDQTHAA
jgi:hypothetical protein